MKVQNRLFRNHERWELTIKQMMESQGVTEQLKAENAMLWVGKVNNIRVDEIVRNELIYIGYRKYRWYCQRYLPYI